MRFEKVALIGVGLLGGSLGLALKERGLADLVHGYVRRPESVDECVRLRVVDEASMDLARVVTGADLVVFCTPIAQMLPLAQMMKNHLKKGALVTDVGSVKGAVVNALEPVIREAGAIFIGSHPMAGSEKTGPASARADLFQKATTVITPTPGTPNVALQQMEQLWQMIGARTLCLTPEQHDDWVCRSSHLPHVVAAALTRYVLDPTHPAEQALLCATGFRDTTRVASGSPEMWRDIAMHNQKNLAQTLNGYIRELENFKRVLDKGDAQAIMDYFEKARHWRENWRQQS
jgi:prephenate dehydrogenase